MHKPLDALAWKWHRWLLLPVHLSKISNIVLPKRGGLNYTINVLHSICQQIWKTQQWPQDWKMSVFIPISKKGNANDCPDYCTTALISQASKVRLKILQARLQQYVNWELPDIQAEIRKGRGTTDQIVSIHWTIEKAREFQKNICFCFTDYAKTFDWVDNCGNFLNFGIVENS